MKRDMEPQSSLDAWLELIRRQDMPIFDQTVQRIIALSSDDRAPMSDLADVILHDSSMTARVLKLANSILYNPSTNGINTITRAVIVLGFNAVRNICLTLTLIDTLVQGAAKERLGRELGRAMHAAVQARSLAAARGDKSPEEVFIATLLYRIGELAFWCFGGEQADRVEQLASQQGLTQEQAQERVLGFRLSQLSRQLVQEWHLSQLLQDATQYPTRQDPRIQNVMLGHQIARCAEEHGWQSDAMSKLFTKAAKLAELSPEKTKALLLQKARAAIDVATDFGAAFAAPHIPQPYPETAVPEAARSADSSAPAATASLAEASNRDPEFQAKVLRELSAVLEGSACSFNVIMELVLEGIFRGVGVDRVVFALTTPDKSVIKAKYALGADDDALSERFAFKRPSRGQDVLFQTLDHKHPYLVESTTRPADAAISERLTELTKATAFMVAPIVVENRSIGLFYADRSLTNRPLDAASFDDFKHFVHQASMGLTRASVRRHQ
ncbi:HDOD domain-containing protein [Thiorhodococcus mannitoliphagus]|uniref:HDOD domain-containing protein n=2 Tax=Thiorhodococcus mannitoliphagus TaxID=329406 RepID=A0A6P1DQ27_9GAMM|nr:HDOD domain-containing protein [Thiorhodococcus mannitoliphagus]